MYPSSAYTVHSLDFDKCGAHNTTSLCGMVVVGILAVVLFTSMDCRPMGSSYALHEKASTATKAMLTSISARAVKSTDGKSSMLQNAKTKYKQDLDLFECSKDNPADKAQCQKEVMAYLAKHKNVMMLIFAPWCSHCHTMMPRFADACKRHNVRGVMVNAESMADLSALHAVEYFPTILVFKGGDDKKEVSNPEEAAEAVKGTDKDKASAMRGVMLNVPMPVAESDGEWGDRTPPPAFVSGNAQKATSSNAGSFLDSLF